MDDDVWRVVKGVRRDEPGMAWRVRERTAKNIDRYPGRDAMSAKSLVSHVRVKYTDMIDEELYECRQCLRESES